MPLFRRRPLLRAAAVGGGAYYMGKRHAEGQEQQADQEQRIENLEGQQAAAPVAAPATASASGGGISAESVQRLQELGLLRNEALWVLVEEIAQSPVVTAAIGQQGVGFANQVAGVVRQRSGAADDRLERLVRRLARRTPRTVSASPEDGEPAPAA